MRPMPYIITTTKPEMADHITPSQPWPRTTTKRAVATLDEARRYGYEAVGRACSFSSPDWRRLRADFYALPESGGTIGPLPDGTVIEVQPVEWAEIAYEAGYVDTPGILPDEPTAILNAFNAR